jgi:putative lipoic acid-binding regulatory protein
MDRDTALSLLRRRHAFPGPFQFRVVVRPPTAPLVVSAIAAGAGDDARVESVNERKSRNGNYVAVHVTVHLTSAEAVLDVYEVLRGVDGVLATL